MNLPLKARDLKLYAKLMCCNSELEHSGPLRLCGKLLACSLIGNWAKEAQEVAPCNREGQK